MYGCEQTRLPKPSYLQGRIHIFDGKDSRYLLRVVFVSCSPNSFYVWNKTEKIVQIWDIRQGKEVKKLKPRMEEVRGAEVLDGFVYFYGKFSQEQGHGCALFDERVLK